LGYLSDVLAATGPSAGNPTQLAADAGLTADSATAVSAALRAHGAKGLWAVKAALPEGVGYGTIKVVAAMEALGAAAWLGGEAAVATGVGMGAGGSDGEAQQPQQQLSGVQPGSQAEPSFSFPQAHSAATQPTSMLWAPGGSQPLGGASGQSVRSTRWRVQHAGRDQAMGGYDGGSQGGSLATDLSLASMASSESMDGNAQHAQQAQQQEGEGQAAEGWHRWAPAVRDDAPLQDTGVAADPLQQRQHLGSTAAAAPAAEPPAPAPAGRKRAIPGSLLGSRTGSGGKRPFKVAPAAPKQPQNNDTAAAAAALVVIDEGSVLRAVEACGSGGASVQQLLQRLTDGAATAGDTQQQQQQQELADVLSKLVGETEVYMRGPNASDASALDMLNPDMRFCLL